MNNFMINEETLNRDLQALKKIKNKLKKIEEIEDLKHSYMSLRDINELYFNKEIDEIKIEKSIEKQLKKRQNKILYNQLNRYLEDSLLKDIAFNFFNNYYSYYLDNDKVLKKRDFKAIKGIILSFYGNIGNLEYSVAKKMFDEERIGLAYEDEFNGFAYISAILGNGYIFINEKMSLNDNLILTLTHEIGHIIDGKLQNDFGKIYSSTNVNFLTELMSTIYELLISKYMIPINNNIYDYSCSRIINSTILNISNLLIYYSDNYKIRNNSLIAYNNTEKFEMSNAILYSFPTYLSLKLLDNNIDINDINKSIRYVISRNYNLTYEEIVKIFNLDLNDFRKCIIKSNNMKRYLKKQNVFF